METLTNMQFGGYLLPCLEESALECWALMVLEKPHSSVWLVEICETLFLPFLFSLFLKASTFVYLAFSFFPF